MIFAYHVPVIYQFYNKINGHSYIGSSIHYHRRTIEHRSFLKRGVHHSQYLQRAWNKYGKDQFDFRILEIVSRDNISEREQWWIDLLCPQYNIGLYVDAPMRGKTHTESYKKRLREMMAGEGNPFYGKKHSEETIKFLREKGLKEGGRFKKGHKHTEESKLKMSQSCIGRKGPIISEEARKRLSEQRMGSKNPMYGKEFSAETRQRMSESHKGLRNSLGHKASDETKQKMSEAQKKRWKRTT